MLFGALIVSLGYLWLDFRELFASNSLKLCFKLFFLTDVSDHCEAAELPQDLTNR